MALLMVPPAAESKQEDAAVPTFAASISGYGVIFGGTEKNCTDREPALCPGI